MLDAHDGARAALVADFAEFYSGLDFEDVWTGRLAPRRALQLVGGLNSIPYSRYAELARGNEAFGWDRNSPMLADIADSLTAIAVGLGGKKLRADQLTRRPKPVQSDEEKKRRPATIADFDVAWFMRQL